MICIIVWEWNLFQGTDQSFWEGFWYWESLRFRRWFVKEAEGNQLIIAAVKLTKI